MRKKGNMNWAIQNSKGFSLISAMVSAVILVIGIMALIRIFPQSSVINANADRISLATNLAEDKIEEFRMLGYAALRSKIVGGAASGTDTVNQVLRHYQLMLDTPYADIIQIRVTCSWKNAGRADTSVLELATFIPSL